MNKTRIKQLHKALDDENISYSELMEIDELARQAGIEVTDEMMSVDVLIALEEKIQCKF